MKNLKLKFFIRLFGGGMAFFCFPVFAVSNLFSGGNKNPTASASLSRLEKLRQAGNLSGFRLELENLLESPAKDFFFITEKLFDPKRRKKKFSSTYHLVLLPGHNKVIDSFSDTIKHIVSEEIAMAYVLLPPLGKQDRDGLTPLMLAARSGNPAAADLFKMYEAPDHEIYESEKNTVWEANPEAYSAKEDNIWRRLPSTPLEETAVGRSLLKGDFDGFLKALRDLYEGPAWEVIALLHSRETKTQKTIFHLLAQARPSLSEIVRPAVFEFLKEKGQSDEVAEKHSQQLSENIEKRQEQLQNENFEAAQFTSNKIYSYLAGINELSDEERNNLLGLEGPFAVEQMILPEETLNRLRGEAVEAVGNIIETVVPSGLSGWRKDKEKTKAAYMKSMIFNGTTATLSLSGAAAAYDINLYTIGSGLVLAGGWTFTRCYKAFKSYRELKQSAPAGSLPPPVAEKTLNIKL